MKWQKCRVVLIMWPCHGHVTQFWKRLLSCAGPTVAGQNVNWHVDLISTIVYVMNNYLLLTIFTCLIYIHQLKYSVNVVLCAWSVVVYVDSLQNHAFWRLNLSETDSDDSSTVQYLQSKSDTVTYKDDLHSQIESFFFKIIYHPTNCHNFTSQNGVKNQNCV